MAKSIELVEEERKADGAEERDSDDRAALLGRVLASPHFARSPKLVQFLRYVCGLTIAGRAGEINEQAVGTEVFGRLPGYDSNDDNIVRAHASRLRQKLDAYFAGEGEREPLRIVLPRGGYVPTFVPHMHGGPEVAAVAEEIAVVVPPEPQVILSPISQVEEELPQRRAFLGHPGLRLPHWAITLACCLATAVAVWGVMSFLRDRAIGRAERYNHALWADLFQRNERTVIVPGDSSLVVYNNVTGRTQDLSEYISGGYRTTPEPQAVITPEMLHKIANRRLTSIVDLKVADRILRRPEVSQDHASIVYARDLRMDDLKQANVVLIGSLEANPWVELFQRDSNFVLLPDQKTKAFTILNRSPRTGEEAQYVAHPGSSKHTAYALVSYVPNLSHSGNVLILQGTAMAGTEAAAEFVLERPGLSDLLHVGPGGRLPHFEVLLETANLSGDAPVAKVVAYRVDR